MTWVPFAYRRPAPQASPEAVRYFAPCPVCGVTVEWLQVYDQPAGPLPHDCVRAA